MKREFVVVVERDPDGTFIAHVPALSGCRTQAKSRDQLDERIREAIAVCLDADERLPEELEFVAVERVEVVI
jgi:predicted RNase H-like HicB family nuclease